MSSYTDSAYVADARFRGYMGSRIALENEIAEAMGLEWGEYESFSAPAPYPWAVAEEAATYMDEDLERVDWKASQYWASYEGKKRRGVL
jgi:hypothetical protein